MNKIPRSRLWFSGIMCVLALAACTTRTFRPNLANSMDDAASVHLAVLSVAPWKECCDAMQPNFKMSADDAVKASVRSTMALTQKYLDVIGANAKVVLPGTSFTNTMTTRFADGTTTMTKDESRITNSGDISKVSAPAAVNRTASQLPPTDSPFSKSDLDIGAMMQYRVATAIYQEVQLLNRYIKDAATYDGCTPYLVRLQISLLPKKENEPYDAYMNLSFFLGDFGTELPPTASGGRGVHVIPLLVTDDIEAALQSRTVNQLQQFSLALAGIVSGVGFGTDFQRVRDQLVSAMGRDLNSTFTIARVSENTIRCRIGAQNDPESRFAMVPQTHNASVLVLVPQTGSKEGNRNKRDIVRIAAKTTLTNALNGKDLEAGSRDEIRKRMEQAFSERKMNVNLTDGDVRYIQHCIAANDWGGFNSIMERLCSSDEPKRRHSREYLWLDMVAIRNWSPYSSATFSLPQAPACYAALDEQTSPFIEDGKNSAVVNLRGGKSLDLKQIAATLEVSGAGGPPGPVKLAHSEVRTTPNGIQIIFPSLSALKLIDGKKKPGPDCIKLIVIRPGDTTPYSANCLYVPPQNPGNMESDKPQFTLSTHASVIIADNDRKARMTIVFSGKAGEAGIFFNVKGAEVQVEGSGAGPVVIPMDDGWNANGPGLVSLAFSNLDPGCPVTISAKEAGTTKNVSPLVLPVKQTK